MKHVFISHSHEDARFAKVLVEELSNNGFPAWLDENQLEAMVIWRESIDKAIRDAYAFIVLMSPASAESSYVNYELGFAFGIKLEIIALEYKGLTSDKHFARLKPYKYLQFKNPENYEWDKLYDKLKISKSRYGKALDAIQHIAERIDETNIDECTKAIDALADIENPAAYQKLLDIIEHLQSRRLRAYGLSKLAEITNPNDTRSLSLLENMYSHDNASIRKAAVDVLSKIGNDAAPLLADALDDPDPTISKTATVALHKLGAEVVPHILEIANRKNYTRVWQTLAQMDNTTIPHLLKALEDENVNKREAAIGLLKAKRDRLIPEIMSRLHDEKLLVRLSAIRVLTGLDSPPIIEGLIKCLSDHHPRVRQAAAQALGETYDKNAAPVLANLLADPDKQVQNAAANALLEIGSGALPVLIEKLANGDKEERRDSALLLGEIGDLAAVVPLAIAVYDREKIVKLGALDALRKIGQIVPESLLDLLNNREDRLRGVGAYILGEIKYTSAVPSLVKLLEGRRTNSQLQEEIAEALQKIGTPDAIHIVKEWQKRRR